MTDIVKIPAALYDEALRIGNEARQELGLPTLAELPGGHLIGFRTSESCVVANLLGARCDLDCTKAEVPSWPPSDSRGDWRALPDPLVELVDTFDSLTPGCHDRDYVIERVAE